MSDDDRLRAGELTRRARELAAAVAQTEEYAASVHDQIAEGVSSLAAEARAEAAAARRFAEHERQVADGG